MAKVIEGFGNFSHLKEMDEYNGQSTGKYSIMLTMAQDDASLLESKGVKVKEYEGKKQRKFTSKFDVPVFDANGDEYDTGR